MRFSEREDVIMNTLDKVSHVAERKAMEVAIDHIVKGLDKDRTGEYLKLIDLAEKFYGKGFSKENYDAARIAVQDPNNKWVKYINSVIDDANPEFIKKTALNLGYEAFFRGTKTIRENRKKYNCNIPWLILFDPTSACNMHCEGCWSGTYGHKSNLTFEDMDKIVTQGKELGVYLYLLTGGEPLVKKKEIIQLAEKHNDVEFAIFSNSTLIDDAFCKELVRLGNITFLLSIEGTPETNDARRGAGHFEAVMKAMDLLKKYGIVFGTSICYTKYNVEAVTSDEFFKMITDKGARFGFYFHYMPVGNNAVTDLLPTMEQRKYMIDRIRYIRSDECDIDFYPMDFQNDGEYVGGCIAGGRNYFHINSNGDAEPCVFIHYSNTNIHDNSILEMLQSPLFMAYHEGQPFNRNHLRPCPMLENPELLREMVEKTGAKSTDLQSPESAEHLCGKCDLYAAEWKKAADELWAENPHHKQRYENYKKENLDEEAKASTEEILSGIRG